MLRCEQIVKIREENIFLIAVSKCISVEFESSTKVFNTIDKVIKKSRTYTDFAIWCSISKVILIKYRPYYTMIIPVPIFLVTLLIKRREKLQILIFKVVLKYLY